MHCNGQDSPTVWCCIKCINWERCSLDSFPNRIPFWRTGTVLKGLSFSIQNGESVAIVGVTGAGKTTLINLLNRFYTIQKGAIKINGININDIPLQTLRQQFAVVLQDPEIFSGTLAENITFHHPAITKDKLQAACNYVHLNPFPLSSWILVDIKMLSNEKFSSYLGLPPYKFFLAHCRSQYSFWCQ